VNAARKKIDGFKTVLPLTYAKGANLLFVGVTLS
jgi:hypothetical protein